MIEIIGLGDPIPDPKLVLMTYRGKQIGILLPYPCDGDCCDDLTEAHNIYAVDGIDYHDELPMVFCHSCAEERWINSRDEVVKIYDARKPKPDNATLKDLALIGLNPGLMEF